MYDLLPLLFVLASSEVMSQMSIKHYQVSGKIEFMFLAMMLYSFICWCLYYLYKSSAIGIVQALWSSISIIFSLVLGVMLFGDKVDRIDCIGVAFIIFGSFVILNKV